MSSRTETVGPGVGSISILTYHSISDEAGPTSIPAPVFEAQMRALAETDIDVVGLDAVDRWLSGAASFNRPAVAITFDDAFRDFAETAFPILKKHGFRSCVFVPTAKVGGVEDWAGDAAPRRKLMDWAQIRDLSDAGVDFGSHSCSHRDLTTLSDAELEEELSQSRRRLEEALARPAPYFAPPYGRSNAQVRSAIGGRYEMSVGVRLGAVLASSPRLDLPRIEMHYYRDESRWRSFLAGRGEAYLALRQALRGAREHFERLTASREGPARP